MKQKPTKSTAGWILSFAGRKKSLYISSVLLAALGVLCSVAPYVIMGSLIRELIGGNREWMYYLVQGGIMAAFWIVRILLHSVSTSCSHVATFHVLAQIRKEMCDKLSKLPLGFVKDTPSGSLKNIMVERLDSIETTLSHILPEFTGNLLAPLCVFLYMLTIDWRMALISLITLPLALLCYCTMMIGYEKSYNNTVVKTKILNDTAVEYINGIEVIKAFSKAKSSYERFVTAAQEGANCFIEWMRSCNIPFSVAMILAPCTMVTVLPFGGLFVMNGSLAAVDFIQIIILSVGLIQPIITCMAYSDDIARLKTILGEITGILTQSELERPAENKHSPADASISLENVTFGYHEKEVLHGISMNISAGTVNALVGPSGSGKSTIAKLIASLWDVNGGSIRIGGVDIRDLSLEEYNRTIAYVRKCQQGIKAHHR